MSMLRYLPSIFFQALMAVYMDSKRNAREKFTPKKYRKHGQPE